MFIVINFWLDLNTFHVLADLGNELSAAGVAVDLAFHEKARDLAVSEADEGHEAEGGGENDYWLGHFLLD